jgi:hypothetical protein
MGAIYWEQWSDVEIMSMHGVEMDEVDTDTDQLEYDTDSCEEEEDDCCSSGCMECLGFSWRDFM